MYMYRRVCWDEFFFHQGKRHREYLIEVLCCMVTILLHATTKLESVAQLANMFVTIPAINI